MTTYINRDIGFIIVTKPVPDYPFICTALTMRCACCGSLKPCVATTLGMN